MIVGGNYFHASIVVVAKFLVFCSFQSNPGPLHMGLVTGVDPLSGPNVRTAHMGSFRPVRDKRKKKRETWTAQHKDLGNELLIDDRRALTYLGFANSCTLSADAIYERHTSGMENLTTDKAK